MMTNKICHGVMGFIQAITGLTLLISDINVPFMSCIFTLTLTSFSGAFRFSVPNCNVVCIVYRQIIIQLCLASMRGFCFPNSVGQRKRSSFGQGNNSPQKRQWIAFIKCYSFNIRP